MQRKAKLIARLLLGLIFTVFGANGLAMIFTGQGFIPMPPPSEPMANLMGALFAAGYLMPLVKILEFVGGIMLLTGNFVKLGIVLLAPIVVNILGIHLFVDTDGLIMSVVVTVLLTFLIFTEWDTFSELLERSSD